MSAAQALRSDARVKAEAVQGAERAGVPAGPGRARGRERRGAGLGQAGKEQAGARGRKGVRLGQGREGERRKGRAKTRAGLKIKRVFQINFFFNSFSSLNSNNSKYKTNQA